MAQIPKLYSPTLAQTTAATRTQPPIRSTSSTRVASIDPQVTELNTGFAAANLDTAPFTFSGDHPPEHGQERQGREKAPNNRALLMISSRAFGALLEYYGNEVFPLGKPRQSGGLISQAIATYENNAKIIHGKSELTGLHISMRL
ncbi:MAG: hypothetical protein CBB68_11530 [Rhodospirillaceae bacterium TMED8]|nr:hypothetical protein [Magnetovibrio sp.]OUT49626.1 MAG: hypothetical protein CBB68_11530 [Rhodospirillaceae bacterium TMED8]|tara:strand:+ start:2453 stop:2887 length:435 start_codon:yes stop_codon:yes gene_type:complete